MPVDLKRIDERKEKMERFIRIQESLRVDIQGLYNLLGLTTSAGSDVRISEAIQMQLTAMSSKFANLKEIVDLITNPDPYPNLSAPEISGDELQEKGDDQTQVNNSKVGSSRTSSTSSMEKLKELTNRLVNLTARSATAA